LESLVEVGLGEGVRVPKTLEEGDEEEDGTFGQASEEDVSPVEGSRAEGAAKRESERVSDTLSYPISSCKGSTTILPPYTRRIGRWIRVRREGLHLQGEQRQEVQRRLEREQSVGCNMSFPSSCQRILTLTLDTLKYPHG
jgi:hypothetical protein